MLHFYKYHIYKLSFLLFLTFGIACNSFASNVVIDSLKRELQTVSVDTQRVLLMIDIGWEYHNKKPSKTIEYGFKAYDLAHKIDYKRGIIRSLNCLGIGYELIGEADKAIEYFNSGLALSRSYKDQRMTRSILNNLGLVEEFLGNHNRAMEYLLEALNMCDEGKDQELISSLLTNIGIILLEEKQYDNALDYFNRSLIIERSLNSPIGIATALTNIGEAYKDLKSYPKALIAYKEALVVCEENNDILGEAILLNNMGEVHYENDLLDLSNDLLKQSLSLSKQIDNKNLMTETLRKMAILSQKQKRYYAAIEYSKTSLELARTVGMKKEVLRNFEVLARNYVAINDYKKAFEYEQLINQAKDSLFNVEKSRQLLELTTMYDTKRKETENQLLKEQQAKSEALIQSRTITSVGIALILILVSCLAFVFYKSNRQKQKYNYSLEAQVKDRTKELESSNKKLRVSNKELERFAYIASHDLKEPLRNIMSFTRLVERKLPVAVKEDGDISEYMQYIVNNTKQMHHLIEDVLEFSRLNNTEISYEPVDLKSLCELVSKVLDSTLKEKNVDLMIGNLPTVFSNHSQVFLVIKNLVENGIKYNTSSRPEIRIFAKENQGMLEITVSDNGIGIEKAYQGRVFGMFKRLHNREEYQGSGLGLSISKKIVNILGGKIWLESEVGKGSKFTFSLPISESQVSKKQMSSVHADDEEKTPV